ncbi:putative membrane protein, partial [Vibrio harveyi]
SVGCSTVWVTCNRLIHK